ncbi:PVC-type heme-binding CxxCH protein [Tellurirhabdus rosea]|uniref:PVC-type heme-binding CxxCH protein n=1 Tax=Tellurirhabdus rosea TaxID=2674997 RepID=UPI00225C03EF|nr:PVC-type heme-binding CxxCH protein [Tellurirhabdus rosea]
MRFSTGIAMPKAPFLMLSGFVASLFWWAELNERPATPAALPAEPESRVRQSAPLGSDSARLYLPDDLEATLWAESPQFFNPTNLDIDARGRVWVTEAVNYRDFNNKPDARLNHAEGERVVILEDTNGDGRADHSKVFVQDKDLKSPLGIAVIGNKVIVSAAPHLVVYTDQNGDDKPDKKEILLTGFGGLDHDHSLHALVTGPDGNWYFNTGNAGPHLVTDKAGWTLRSGSLYTGGTPYNLKNEGAQTSDDGQVWVGGLALRVRPDGTGLKVLAHNFRNNYETALDSYGNLWQNDNDDQVVACRTSFVLEGGSMGYFSADGTRYWQGDQRPGQSIAAAHWHQEDPGVVPLGDLTGAGSPTGVVVYEGDELGPQYRGMLLSAEAGRNVIFSYKPEPEGAGFRLPRRDFISTFPQVDETYKWNDVANDTRKWFRPSDVAVGTDGALYVADWYDPIVGGHAMHDKKGYGRIYRITPKNRKLTTPRIDVKTTKGQILALQNPAVNVRALGFAALRAKGEKAIKPVKKLLTAANPFHRARAIWLLAQLGPKGVAEVEKLTVHPDENTRLVAFRALKPLFTDRNQYQFPQYRNLVSMLAEDPSAAVRREVAIVLRDVPFDDCRVMLAKLFSQYDGRDRYYLTALGIASWRKTDAIYDMLRTGLPADPTQWSQPQADLVWELHPAAAAEAMKQRAAAPALSAEARRQALVALGFMNDEKAARFMADLTKSADTTLARQADYWVSFRRGNDWANLLNWDEVVPPKRSESEQRMLALRQKLLDEYTKAEEKQKLAREMAATPEGGKLLVGLAADKKLPSDLTALVGEVIFSNPDLNVRIMAADYFTKPGASASLSPQKINALNGSKTAGLTVFKTHCATCHRHGEQGNNIGPQLTRIHTKFDRNGLLDAILNPSASLAFGYEPWLITTQSGDTHYGFLISDNKQALVIKDAAGQKQTIPTSKIASRKQYTTSLMPDPTAMGLSEQQLADLLAFLMNPS